ncbi:hypothetical protein BDR26DRAFT_897973 [Obelidium mucronatum]|nr:hypothetical protein BDR26DRAFT_897973 [Obelidium mucronatum]
MESATVIKDRLIRALEERMNLSEQLSTVSAELRQVLAENVQLKAQLGGASKTNQLLSLDSISKGEAPTSSGTCCSQARLYLEIQVQQLKGQIALLEQRLRSKELNETQTITNQILKEEAVVSSGRNQTSVNTAPHHFSNGFCVYCSSPIIVDDLGLELEHLRGCTFVSKAGHDTVMSEYKGKCEQIDKQQGVDDEEIRDAANVSKEAPETTTVDNANIDTHVQKTGAGESRVIRCSSCKQVIRSNSKIQWTIHILQCPEVHPDIKSLFDSSLLASHKSSPARSKPTDDRRRTGNAPRGSKRRSSYNISPSPPPPLPPPKRRSTEAIVSDSSSTGTTACPSPVTCQSPQLSGPPNIASSHVRITESERGGQKFTCIHCEFPLLSDKLSNWERHLRLCLFVPLDVKSHFVRPGSAVSVGMSHMSSVGKLSALFDSGGRGAEHDQTMHHHDEEVGAGDDGGRDGNLEYDDDYDELRGEALSQQGVKQTENSISELDETDIGAHVRRRGTGSNRSIFCAYCNSRMTSGHKSRWTAHIVNCSSAPSHIRKFFGGDVPPPEMESESDFSEVEERVSRLVEEEEEKTEDLEDEKEVEESVVAGNRKMKRDESDLIDSQVILTGSGTSLSAVCKHCLGRMKSRKRGEWVTHFHICAEFPSDVLTLFQPQYYEELLPFPREPPQTLSDGTPNIHRCRSWKDILKVQRPNLHIEKSTGLFATSFKR